MLKFMCIRTAFSGARRLFRARAALILLILSGMSLTRVHGQGVATFPDVPLVNGSEPRYTSLALDEKGERVLFVLFDGTVDAGYARAYLWIPSHPQYGRPVAVARGDGGVFPPVAVAPGPDANVDTTWQLRAWSEDQAAQGEQTGKRHDYATGTTVEYKQEAREARRVARFGFVVRYRHAGASGRGVATATDLLDLEMGGDLPIGAKWTERPAPLAPWNQLHAQGTMELGRNEKTPDSGTIRLKTGLGCRVVSMPQDARVEFEVFPYLQDPVASESVPAMQALSAGFEAVVPFGWYQYRIRWNVEGITVRPFERDVFPFSRQ